MHLQQKSIVPPCVAAVEGNRRPAVRSSQGRNSRDKSADAPPANLIRPTSLANLTGQILANLTGPRALRRLLAAERLAQLDLRSIKDALLCLRQVLAGAVAIKDQHR